MGTIAENKELSGQLKIQVSADFTVAGVNFTGAYESSSHTLIGIAKNVSFRKLFGGLDFDLELKEIYCSYGDDQYSFRTVLGNSINLSDLPLVGKTLPKNQTLTIENLALMIEGKRDTKNNPKDTGTGKNSKPTVGIGADIKLGDKTLVTVGKNSGQIGGYNSPVKNVVAGSTNMLAGTNEKTQPALTSQNESPPAAAQNGMVKWFPFNKTIGPVSFKRVGVICDMKNDKLSFLLDASMAMGPLNVELAGLGVGSSIKNFKPEFTLDGLGISYSQGGILISGALLYDQFDKAFTGGVIIKTPIVSIAALGGYQDLDGEASLFIYGVLSSSSGLVSVALGPVFLQVNGIAAGFGYNRRLIVPEVDKIKEFPLVSIASGDSNVEKNPLELLKKVKQYIPASKGDLFLAFGVKFNIQKLIDCFALFILRMGSKLCMDIVGLAKVALPTQASNPLAQVEMAYKVSFDFDEGAFKVAAALTPASYIFTKECRLTGGFAFYAWFYGEHAGDFVLSIGGYHPQFNIPAHYPRVPRVGFQWQLLPELSLKGELYCALTPSAIMAGGLLQAVFKLNRTIELDIWGIAGVQLTGMINASFTMSMDLLISWQPFYYKASMDVNIGIQAYFKGTAYFLCYSKTVERSFDLHLGAGLQIWGPSFSGIAHVDWSIISFDIAFGEKAQTTKPALNWQEFQNAFLPDKNSVCAVSVTDGLNRQMEGGKAGSREYIVNPGEMVLITNSTIPILKSNVSDTAGKEFGIGSMQINNIDTSNLTIKINRVDSSNEHITIDNEEITKQFDFEPVFKSVPASMWGKTSTPDLDSPGLIDKMLMGFKITPKKKVDSDNWVAGKDSEYEVDADTLKCNWETVKTFKENRTDDQDKNTIIDSMLKNTERENLLGDFFSTYKDKTISNTNRISLSEKLSHIFLAVPKVGNMN